MCNFYNKNVQFHKSDNFLTRNCSFLSESCNIVKFAYFNKEYVIYVKKLQFCEGWYFITKNCNLKLKS